MNIKKKIKESGLTLVEIGQRMSKPMSQQSMSALLKEDANPSINKLAEIAGILGISLAELVGDTDAPSLQAMVRLDGQMFYFESFESLETFIAEHKNGEYHH